MQLVGIYMYKIPNDTILLVFSLCLTLCIYSVRALTFTLSSRGSPINFSPFYFIYLFHCSTAVTAAHNEWAALYFILPNFWHTMRIGWLNIAYGGVGATEEIANETVYPVIKC